MNWKRFFNWFANLFAGSIFSDLIFNWSGIKKKLAAIAPFVDLFLPHIGVAGILTIVAINIALQIPFLMSLRASEKFRNEYSDLDDLRYKLPNDKDAYYCASEDVDMRDYETMNYIKDICDKFSIPCLKIVCIGARRSNLIKWRYFTNDLVRCSLNKKLKEARNLLESKPKHYS